jgi:hypothetical protein
VDLLAHARARFGHSTAGGCAKQVLAANLAALAVLKTLTTLSVSSLLPCSARPLVLHQYLSTIDHFTGSPLATAMVQGDDWRLRWCRATVFVPLRHATS